jgi:hypothetical protein
MSLPKTWTKVAKVWADLYHPPIYKPRDHSAHSKKRKPKKP